MWLGWVYIISKWGEKSNPASVHPSKLTSTSIFEKGCITQIGPLFLGPQRLEYRMRVLRLIGGMCGRSSVGLVDVDRGIALSISLVNKLQRWCYECCCCFVIICTRLSRLRQLVSGRDGRVAVSGSVYYLYWTGRWCTAAELAGWFVHFVRKQYPASLFFTASKKVERFCKPTDWADTNK